ncbi:hypothetical protein DPEC_G00167430 [Dallia pectoralis]|uniref:Uncharacterized protein n=1 Tax=Dallia pectoralis TaxID=75939 RepID=A0ACC2GIF7_DALPE|nr:hypothetical protein DPEC_G00167430 [Dallia pectoralis]
MPQMDATDSMEFSSRDLDCHQNLILCDSLRQLWHLRAQRRLKTGECGNLKRIGCASDTRSQ